MLLEFKCSNHRSIKEQVSFSMLAGADNTNEECLMTSDKFRVLRSAVIYGANGSGKSNFIDALSFVRNMVSSSLRYEIDRPLRYDPHKLSKKDEPSEYDIQFMRNDVRYAYGFSLTAGAVHSEYLYYFPNNKQVKVFEREGMKIKPGDKYKKSFEITIKDILQENRLFLSCAANYSNVQEIKETYRFFRGDMRVWGADMPFSGYLPFRAISEETSKIIIDMLQTFGTNVREIKIKEPGMVDPEEFANYRGVMPPREYILRTRAETKMVYDQFEINLSEESRGVKRLFQVIPSIYNALENGTILVFDELESSLHECVLAEIVKLFNDPQKNKGAQLIFSTHNTNLLDSDLFRRDQVWFTELNEERVTDLYSLVDIKNVRKSENLAKGYISGKYGAIPMLNKGILEERH